MCSTDICYTDIFLPFPHLASFCLMSCRECSTEIWVTTSEADMTLPHSLQGEMQSATREKLLFYKSPLQWALLMPWGIGCALPLVVNICSNWLHLAVISLMMILNKQTNKQKYKAIRRYLKHFSESLYLLVYSATISLIIYSNEYFSI